MKWMEKGFNKIYQSCTIMIDFASARLSPPKIIIVTFVFVASRFLACVLLVLPRLGFCWFLACLHSQS